jgi:hypothetical protein
MARKPWYLATPYSAYHTDGSRCEWTEDERFQEACRNAALLIEAGYCVFCPIAHSHQIDRWGVIEHDAWYAQDNDIIWATDWAGLILAPGWERSKGCLAERAVFAERGLPILTVDEALEAADE